MSTVDQWATDNLSIFLGLDPDTLSQQVLPYLNTFNTPDDLANHLQTLLGITPATTDFIYEYTSRRFGPPPPPPPPPAKRAPSSSSRSQFLSPAQIAQQNVTRQAWASEKNVYRKKDTEDEYFVGKQKKQSGSKPTSANPSPAESPDTSRPSSPSQSQPQPPQIASAPTPSTKENQHISGSSLTSDTMTKKKKKKVLEDSMDLEKALRELDINTSVDGKKRKACQCQATKHPILTIAPNCLSCGKIICTLEGPGPCTFCGTPVLSRDQQHALINEAKRKRAEEAQARQRAASKKTKAPGAGGGTVAYSAKLSGAVIPRRTEEVDWEEEERKEAERLSLAEAHKERLLEFDRTSAKRSRVIDQATDFTLPNDRPNLWETPQERALALKKQLANLNRLESPQTRRVMTIDVEGRRILFEDAPAIREDDDGDGQEVAAQKTGRTQHQQRMGGMVEMSAGTYARNPFLGGQAPKFVRGTMELAKKAEEKVGKGKGKEKDKTKGEEKMNEARDKLQEVKSARPARLQHEIDVGFAERLLLSGEDGGRESTVEPGCG